ncbi:chemotaxis response regulator protein-glutamate methylesterase [Alishewanella longhuensis]|uniref:Protein-glutamate methylesterase/protein-glutamine glutaminase n=1 Tax=Alishewanella longhuensis TaxID=1091037 RepID=A0ABQ3KV43_9ALTE|nr:chemotaxis response regulator protein-glutamate methylesterase [Alishewanella longhuensis]GHG63376.1 chemotaxis response regulator protein-glutamate methylesterase [Alishewanella longhuensis]
MSGQIKVFIVDDSAVVRQVLTQLLSADAQINVIGSAPDPIFALQKMQANWPDVIVLDVEMPRMDGITFLRQLMQEHPTPVVICSTLTEKGADTTLQALASGAVDIITKPKVGLRDFLESSSQHMLQVVKAAARAKVRALASGALRGPLALKVASMRLSHTSEKVVALGTSTGGTQALEVVLTQMPSNCPGIVVVQHMPEKFTAAFAQRLNKLCYCEVREAVDGDKVTAGLVLIAPGGLHMQLRRSGNYYRVAVGDGPAINRHKPSVDVLFRSVANVAGENAIGIIMTGMGDDGANGLLAMRQAGAHTIAQDRDSSVVFGMPREAIARGAAIETLPLASLAQAIVQQR